MEFQTIRNKRRSPDNSPLPRHSRGTRASRMGGHGHHKHLSSLQAHLVAATGEFVGTFWFLFFGYAGHLMVIDETAQSDTPGASTVIYVSLACMFNCCHLVRVRGHDIFIMKRKPRYLLSTSLIRSLDGFSLLVTVWALYRISGGLFNPAVTLGLSLAGELPWARAAFLIPTQLIASICAGAVVKVLFPGDLSSINTSLLPGVNLAQGVFAEMFFTSYLVFVVLILAAEKSKDTFLAPIGIGLALFVAEIPGVYFTGGSLNPARSFGCAVASANFPRSHWIYWVGPVLGAIMAPVVHSAWLLRYCIARQQRQTCLLLSPGMPKKRHQSYYSKPPSVAPASLRLSSSSQTSPDRRERSVNELLSNLRVSSTPRSNTPHSAAALSTTPSLPPTLRHILQLPETPAPAPRRSTAYRRTRDGRRLPPGPPPPRSWITLAQSRHAPVRPRHDVPGHYIQHWPLPGAYAPDVTSLIDVVLRRMALDWAQQRDWNRFYLYTLPSRLRSALLRYVSEMHGPGVSVEDLRLVLLGPSAAELAEYGLEPPDIGVANADIFYLELTGSSGKSFSLKELNDFLFGPKHASTVIEDDVQDSWDAPASPTVLRPAVLLPNLTHLSLAVDPGSPLSVSWKQLLSLAGKLTGLTHLSLAGWPEPSLTPNAKFAKITSPTTGQNIQYGGTGPYSHNLDNDWAEGILLLKRLSKLLYGLEYLDLSGCRDWFPALREQSDGEFQIDVVDWVGDWGKITTLRLNSGYAANDASKTQILQIADWIAAAVAVEKHIRAQRAGRGRWITVERDQLSDDAQNMADGEKTVSAVW
ncbi:hypothetical protein GGR57DRAFT_499808 [Xylariaceae sp. FL1272]|nr:hypothetical protein GGR57DRAFT_499808 [Xylariaceae sp. FL1272]